MKYLLNKKNTYLLLFFIILFGSFLKLYAIGDESFWLDESATAHAIRDHSLKEIAQNIYFLGTVTPGYFEQIEGLYAKSDLPVYYMMLEPWSWIFGTSETSLRLFSVLLGILFTILIFFLAKELFDVKVALVSSLLSVINLTIIFHSQEARVYMLLLFLATVSFFILIKCLSSTKNIYWILFTIVNIIGLFSHYFYVFIVFSQGVFLLFYLKKYSKYFKHIIASFLTMGLFFLPLIPRFFERGGETFLGRPTVEGILRVIVQFNTWIYPSSELQQNIYSKSFDLISLPEMLLIFSVILLSIILPIFFIVGIIKSTNFNNNIHKFLSNNYKIVFLLLWLTLPFLLNLGISLIHPTVRIFGPIRYLLYTFPPYLILISLGLTRLRKKYFSMALVVILIASILPLSTYYLNPVKEEWIDTVDYVKNNIKVNEVILLNSHTTRLPFWYYYGNAGNILGVRNVEQTKLYSENKDGVWLILAFDRYKDPEGYIKSYLDKTFPNSQEQKFFDIRIIHYTN